MYICNYTLLLPCHSFELKITSKYDKGQTYVYIDDKNDGGCKSDKFERDVYLLRADVADNPKNDRAHYYLGQSLKDLGKFEEAIEMFMKRIELGGWFEERWYAHYQIAKCYDHMGQPYEMEAWMNRALDAPFASCGADLFHV